MTLCKQTGRGPRRLFGLVAITLVAATAFASADPGDLAKKQNRYKAIQNGAKSLLKAWNALDTGKDDSTFKGHRVKAMKLINEALAELDEAVNVADDSEVPADKGKPFFDTKRGKLALEQTDYKAIHGGAKNLHDGGRSLDVGNNNFGGHRIKALKLIHSALDELDEAVKAANKN